MKKAKQRTGIDAVKKFSEKPGAYKTAASLSEQTILPAFFSVGGFTEDAIEYFSVTGIGYAEKITYTDEPMKGVKVVSDFLPSPEELVLKDETVKVTISLSKTSVEFFKEQAKKHNSQYQKMIRRLLAEYAAHQA